METMKQVGTHYIKLLIETTRVIVIRKRSVFSMDDPVFYLEKETVTLGEALSNRWSL